MFNQLQRSKSNPPFSKSCLLFKTSLFHIASQEKVYIISSLLYLLSPSPMSFSSSNPSWWWYITFFFFQVSGNENLLNSYSYVAMKRGICLTFSSLMNSPCLSPSQEARMLIGLLLIKTIAWDSSLGTYECKIAGGKVKNNWALVIAS